MAKRSVYSILASLFLWMTIDIEVSHPTLFGIGWIIRATALASTSLLCMFFISKFVHEK